MSDEYRQGDWWIIDDQSGQKTRASRSRIQWDGLVVDKKNYDPRQPLDLLKQIKDDPSVPYARTRQPDQFVGFLQTQIIQASPAGSNVLYVESNVRMLPGDRITVPMSNLDMFTTYIVSISTLGQIVVSPPLPFSVPAGGTVTDYTADTGDNLS